MKHRPEEADSQNELVKCTHTVTQGRIGKKGSWCKSCGEKIFSVDSRPCGDCKHYREDRPLFDKKVGICEMHLMRVSKNMFVTYEISKGSCWATN